MRTLPQVNGTFKKVIKYLGWNSGEGNSIQRATFYGNDSNMSKNRIETNAVNISVQEKWWKDVSNPIKFWNILRLHI